MRAHAFRCTLAILLVTAGCASTKDADETQAVSPVAFSEIKLAPDSHKDRRVTFGGEVLTARRLKEGTRIEILQLPLDRSGRPGYDLTQSQGRFIVMHRDFLDPATLPYGTRVTVTGPLTGSIVLPLDDTEYTYPVIEAEHIQVWAEVQSDGSPRIRPYIGPGPYWGPYGGPYWGPWPYRW